MPGESAPEGGKLQAMRQQQAPERLIRLLIVRILMHYARQGPARAPRRARTHARRTHKAHRREGVECVRAAQKKIGSEAGMLSGISRKRSIRSNPYWFTEFCNSQCLSHFAAPFIVVRAETSIAESCQSWLATIRDYAGWCTTRSSGKSSGGDRKGRRSDPTSKCRP